MTTAAEPKTVWRPYGRAMTRAERDAVPDDGRRHELIDGALLVTPAPSWGHQSVSGELFFVLYRACPPELQVLFAPLDVDLAEDTVVEPDLLVAPTKDFVPRGLPVPPLLAIEILSPSTRHIDLHLKKARYETAGTPSYWVVDPDVPSITAWELRDGAYALAGEAAGDESLTLELPFGVTVVPNDLLRTLPKD